MTTIVETPLTDTKLVSTPLDQTVEITKPILFPQFMTREKKKSKKITTENFEVDYRTDEMKKQETENVQNARKYKIKQKISPIHAPSGLRPIYPTSQIQLNETSDNMKSINRAVNIDILDSLLYKLDKKMTKLDSELKDLNEMKLNLVVLRQNKCY